MSITIYCLLLATTFFSFNWNKESLARSSQFSVARLEFSSSLYIGFSGWSKSPQRRSFTCSTNMLLSGRMSRFSLHLAFPLPPFSLCLSLLRQACFQPPSSLAHLLSRSHSVPQKLVITLYLSIQTSQNHCRKMKVITVPLLSKCILAAGDTALGPTEFTADFKG